MNKRPFSVLKNFLVGSGKGRQGPPQVPAGLRLYCVGDIHGRDDLLMRLHAAIIDDGSNYSGRKIAVYLGDYIDRGLASKAVIDRLLQQPLPGFECIYLRGNHEQALQLFLQFPETGADWLNYGGIATLYSYGVQMQGIPQKKAQLRDISKQLQALLPAAHQQFFTGLRRMYAEGDYAFVHAGIRPGVALNRQLEDDLLWIREEFTQSKQRHEKIVVHGHSVTDEPEVRPNRIGIDTGAYCSGNLTCLVLEGAQQRFINTRQAL